MKYLAASVVIAAAAAVYGLFSHGVYSYYMTYAFMIPLLAGALPHLIAAMKRESTGGDAETDRHELPAESEKPVSKEPAAFAKIFDAKEAQLAVIATLTAGSLLNGALDIYGTSNRLLIAYPIAAAAVLAAAIALGIKRKKTKVSEELSMQE